VDNIFLSRINDSKPGAEREAGPIRGGTHDVTAGQISAERISASAFLSARVGSRANIRHAAKVRICGFDSGQGLLHNRLSCATNQDTTNSKNYCKIKAF